MQETDCANAKLEECTEVSRAYYRRIELGTHAATIGTLIEKSISTP